MSLLWDIRDATAEDMNFVMATFLRGLYYGDSWFSQIPKDIFMNHYKVAAQAAWLNPSVKFKIACLKEDRNVILGYSVYSADEVAVIWCFVKSAWRNQGICRSLLPQSFAYVTHLTALGKTLIHEKFPEVRFNPFYGANNVR